MSFNITLESVTVLTVRRNADDTYDIIPNSDLGYTESAKVFLANLDQLSAQAAAEGLPSIAPTPVEEAGDTTDDTAPAPDDGAQQGGTSAL